MTLLEDAARLADVGMFDGVVALLKPAPSREWVYNLIATRNFTPPDAPDDARLLAGLGFLPGSEKVNDYGYLQYVDSIPDPVFNKSHPDIGLLTPGFSAADFTGEILPRLTNDDLGPVDVIRLFLWPRAQFTRPLFRIPNQERIVYMAMLRTPTSDSEVVARMLAGNRSLFEQNRSVGGAHYPFGAIRLSRHGWQQHYGLRWSDLVQAKRRYDPDNVFASGPDIF